MDFEMPIDMNSAGTGAKAPAGTPCHRVHSNFGSDAAISATIVATGLLTAPRAFQGRTARAELTYSTVSTGKNAIYSIDKLNGPDILPDQVVSKLSDFARLAAARGYGLPWTCAAAVHANEQVGDA
jgi:hypothetical protein